MTYLPPEAQCGCAPLTEAKKMDFITPLQRMLRGLFPTCCLGRVTMVLAETFLQEQVQHAPTVSGRRPHLLCHVL